MAVERLPYHPRLPLVITPATQLPDLEPVPFGDTLTVARSAPTGAYPENGQLLLATETPTVFVPLTSDATEGQVFGALRLWQHLEPGDAFKKNAVIVVTEKPQQLIESLPFFRDRPLVPAKLLDGILQMEGLQKYGVEQDLGEQLGGLYIRALVFDRVVRSKILGEMGDWDIWYPKYPKTYSKQPLHLAQALAGKPESFYAQIITPEDVRGGVSIFPSKSVAGLGTEKKPVGGIIYSAFTRDDLWPTHRIMGRHEFFEHIPLSTGEHTQNLLTVLAAIDFATSYNLPIAKVFEQAGLQDADLEPFGEMAQDYKQVLDVLGEVLFVSGKRLIDATAEDYAKINEKLRGLNNPRLGEILPSLHTLLSKGVVNLEALAYAERYLYSRCWPAIPEGLPVVLPKNQRDPNALSTDKLITRTTNMIQTNPNDQKDDFEAVRREGLQIWEEGERATHLIETNRLTREFIDLRTQLRRQFIFNMRRFSPFDQEIQHFFKQGVEFIRGTDIVALEPMHEEPLTGRAIADRLRELFPRNRFITGSNHLPTLETFGGFDGIVVHQDIILSFVDRETMRAQGIIPRNAQFESGKIGRHIINTKGDTIRSLLLTGIALGIIHPETLIMTIDSDWENVKGHDKYFPAHYLSGMMANQPPDQAFVLGLLARIGKERRNQVALNQMNRWTNLGTPFQRVVAENKKRIVWPLSGERVLPAYLIMNSPFPNGYSMEIWLDLLASIKDMTDPNLTIAQIATPTLKILTDSLPSKDWAMTMFCSNMYDYFMDFWERTVLSKFETLPEEQKGCLAKDTNAFLAWEQQQVDLLPTNWGPELLTAFNHRHGGMPEIITTPSDAELNPKGFTNAEIQHWENQDFIFSRDFLEPSITWLDENELIDWEGMVDYLINELGVPYDPVKLENAWWRQRLRERAAAAQ